MKENYTQYMEKLQGIYKERFLEIEHCFTIIMFENGDWDLKNEFLMEILDIFLCAQNDNKNIDEIIGDDTMDFCSKFINTINKPKSILKYILESFLALALLNLFYILINIILQILYKKNINIFNLYINISYYINFPILWILMNFVRIILIKRKQYYKNKNFLLKKEKRILYIFKIAGVVISASLYATFMQINNLLIEINAVVGLLISLFYIFIYIFINKKYAKV